MSLFNLKIKTFFSYFSMSSMDLETWAMKCSKITSADKIIGAAIIEDIAKNFGDWDSSHFIIPQGYDGTLRNFKKNITVTRAGKYNPRAVSVSKIDIFLKKGTINGMSVDYAVILQIAEAYDRVRNGVIKAKNTADKALREMEENEKKWDLAEKLLGMKRNEFGALVPVVTVED